MSESVRSSEIRRILVALDASPESLPVLEAVAELASRMEAELLGLFVEDIELLRLAEAPYAREFLYPSASETPLSRETMEFKLRALSEKARTTLAEAAARAQVQWSFRTVRGEILAEVLAAAGEADLLAIGETGGPLRRLRRVSETALEVAAGAAPVLLVPAGGIAPRPRVAVYFDGSPGARFGLDVASQLATAAPDGITVLLGAADPESASALREEAARMFRGKDSNVRHRVMAPDDDRALMEILRAEKPWILVLGGLAPEGKRHWAELLLRETDVAVLLLDGSARLALDSQ